MNVSLFFSSICTCSSRFIFSDHQKEFVNFSVLFHSWSSSSLWKPSCTNEVVASARASVLLYPFQFSNVDPRDFERVFSVFASFFVLPFSSAASHSVSCAFCLPSTWTIVLGNVLHTTANQVGMFVEIPITLSSYADVKEPRSNETSFQSCRVLECFAVNQTEIAPWAFKNEILLKRKHFTN